MTEKIKVLMIKCNTNQKELATKLGISQPALSKKFKLDDWRESDLREIAKVCGAEYTNGFKVNEEVI
mgnify:CR=1 FL=1